VSPARTAEAIEMLFASTTLVGPGKRLLHICERIDRQTTNKQTCRHTDLNTWHSYGSEMLLWLCYCYYSTDDEIRTLLVLIQERVAINCQKLRAMQICKSSAYREGIHVHGSLRSGRPCAATDAICRKLQQKLY